MFMDRRAGIELIMRERHVGGIEIAASPAGQALDHRELADIDAGHRIKLLIMLFMVIEQFKNGDAAPVGERFKRTGRMLPEGVHYQASWVDRARGRCFQVMEAPDAEALRPWIGHWEDLVDFEVIPVVTSSEFWT